MLFSNCAQPRPRAATGLGEAEQSAPLVWGTPRAHSTGSFFRGSRARVLASLGSALSSGVRVVVRNTFLEFEQVEPDQAPMESQSKGKCWGPPCDQQAASLDQGDSDQTTTADTSSQVSTDDDSVAEVDLASPCLEEAPLQPGVARRRFSMPPGALHPQRSVVAAQHPPHAPPGVHRAESSASVSREDERGPPGVFLLDSSLHGPRSLVPASPDLCLNKVATTVASTSAPETRTTVVIRNLPKVLLRAQFWQLLDVAGFAGRYDFVYIPVNFSSGRPFGYAVVNLTSTEVAREALEHFQGLIGFGDGSLELSACWSDHQGLHEHIRRYRNCPVMHAEVPAEHKPALFRHGSAAPFPEPTKKIRQPRRQRWADV